MTEKLVWLPTWYQAQLVCRQLGITDDAIKGSRQQPRAFLPADEFLYLYGLIVEALEHGTPQG